MNPSDPADPSDPSDPSDPADPLGLMDRVVLVTGAGRGLGRSYADCLASHGAWIVVHDGGVDKDGRGSDAACAEQVAEALRADGGTAVAVTEVLRDAASCQRVVAAAREHYGRLDGLIHSAGLVGWADPTTVDEATYATLTGVNSDAAFWLCSAALPVMREQGFGRIVLTTSGWALEPSQGADELALYCLGKGAQFGLGMALAKGAGHPEIRTNVIAPVANTRMYNGQVAAGRLRPEMVAGAVTWMASPACTLTGMLVRAADGEITLARITNLASRTLGGAAGDPVAAGGALAEMAAAAEI